MRAWNAELDAYVIDGDDFRLYLRKYPSPKFGLGGISHLDNPAPGWYWCCTHPLCDWALIEAVDNVDEAEAVALMLRKMK